MREYTLILATFLLSPFAVTNAAIVLVDFGSTNNGLVGYNEVTSHASLISSPLALLDRTGADSGVTLSYSGPTGARTAGVAGINNAITFSEATGNAWEALTDGESIGNVTTQGFGLRLDQSTIPTFTLSGLVAGQEYS